MRKIFQKGGLVEDRGAIQKRAAGEALSQAFTEKEEKRAKKVLDNVLVINKILQAIAAARLKSGKLCHFCGAPAICPSLLWGPEKYISLSTAFKPWEEHDLPINDPPVLKSINRQTARMKKFEAVASVGDERCGGCGEELPPCSPSLLRP